ncbi:MAG: hypothetical protein KDA46_14740, partial [Parvularculaceae bacterium]|nr:hypothetical protein [Parvularculaceae bacterium]
MKGNQSDDHLIAEVRLNIAFEQMIVAALGSSAVSALCIVLLKIGILIGNGVWTISATFMSFYHGISFAAIFFLLSFAAAALIGAPLFRVLEKAKYRRLWPYYFAAAFVGFLCTAALGSPVSIEQPANILRLAPGIMMVAFFGRLIKPFWSAHPFSANSR